MLKYMDIIRRGKQSFVDPSHKIAAHDNVRQGSITSKFKQGELKNWISWGYYMLILFSGISNFFCTCSIFHS
jgi:hypothetical protein